EGGAITLSGGSIGGGPLFNNGAIWGYGAITNSSMTNNAVINQGTGNLSLSIPGNVANNGAINLMSGRQLQLTYASTSFSNAGSINLNSAQIIGVGSLKNTLGGIITGPGAILCSF